MTINSKETGRRSIRLKGYDYSRAGAYFLTICTQHKTCIFGKIADGQMRLNEAGEMVRRVWTEIPTHYPGVNLGEFIVMPNHIHGVVILVGAGPRACPNQSSDKPLLEISEGERPRNHSNSGQPRGGENAGQPQGVAPTSLADVVARFKTLTTHLYIEGVKISHWKSFDGKLWQRNYYEHIIRNWESHNRIAAYIRSNPVNWDSDMENPQCNPMPKNRDSNLDWLRDLI